MGATRLRLINAARRSMIERAELRRKLGVARAELAPGALVDRAKYRASQKVNQTADAARKQFKDNRLPITLAAVAGLAWLLRDPIRQHAPKIGRRIRDIADDLAARLRPAEGDEIESREENDETAE